MRLKGYIPAVYFVSGLTTTSIRAATTSGAPLVGVPGPTITTRAWLFVFATGKLEGPTRGVKALVTPLKRM